jgi:RNA polymerase II subunit A small phosphatase-like protein
MRHSSPEAKKTEMILHRERHARSPQPKQSMLLPPKQRGKDRGKKTLVLDLDETLVHSAFVPIKSPDYVAKINDEHGKCDIHVKFRPGVKKFLN